MARELLDVPMRRHPDRAVRAGRQVLKRPGIGPAMALVEATGASIAGDDGQPGACDARGSEARLGIGHEGVGDAGAAVARRDEHLVDLVVLDRDEARDLAVDDRHGRVGHQARRSGQERSLAADRDELVGDVAVVGVVPAACQISAMAATSSGVAGRRSGLGASLMAARAARSTRRRKRRRPLRRSQTPTG